VSFGGLTTGTTVAARGLGGMAAALGALPGVGTAALAVMTVVPMVFETIGRKAEEARRQAAQFREELAKMSPVALQAAVDAEKAFQAQLRSQQALTLGARRAREQQLAASDQRLGVLQQAQGSQANAVGIARGEDLARFAREAQNAAGALAAFNRTGEVGRDAFLRAAAAWDASRQSALSLSDALDQGNAAARQYLFAAARVAQTEANSKAAAEASAAAAKAAEKATRDRQRAEEEFAKTSQRLDEILRDVGLTSEQRLKKETEGIASAQDFIRAQREKIASTKAEYAALQDGAFAYQQFLDVQRVREAGERAVAEALRVKNDLSKDDLNLIRQQGEELARQQVVLERAKNTGGTRPPVEDTDRWLDSLRDAVGVVQLIGQAFGDVGRTVVGIATAAHGRALRQGRRRCAGPEPRRCRRHCGRRGAGLVDHLGAAEESRGRVAAHGRALRAVRDGHS
jgi:colicin import membrane protein